LGPNELRQRRQALHLSQSDLGRLLGVSRNSVARWERGELPIRHPELVLLALDRLEQDARSPEPGAWTTRGSPHHNLPAELSSFVGREQDFAGVAACLAQARVLTIAGAGGIGKTRLALRLAREVVELFANGVWLVELAPVTVPALVPRSVASVLSLREQPGRSMLASIADAIGDSPMLLVLDNCEHLVDACAELVDYLLRKCADLRVLATSREPLGVTGEVVWPLHSLAVPSDGDPPPEMLERFEAVQLFLERARSISSEFSPTADTLRHIGDICRRLDGIPLAIELAAALVPTLSVSEIAARLGHRFEILTSGPRVSPARHQTLRATVNWSYELLSAAERWVLRQAAVFADGWSLSALEAVCGGPHIPPQTGVSLPSVFESLGRLVSKSMVLRVKSVTGESRYRMLDTIRAFALEQLRESQEEDTARRRHADYFVAGAGEWSVQAGRGPDRARWLDRLDEELPNVREALRWTLERGADEDTRMRWATVLSSLGYLRDHYAEAYSWNIALGVAPRGDRPSPSRARALVGTAVLASTGQIDFAMAVACSKEALPVARELPDKVWLIRAFVSLALAHVTRGEDASAIAAVEEALIWSREVGDRLRESMSLDMRSWLAYTRADWMAARASAEASLEISSELGDTFRQSLNHRQLGDVALALKDPATAHTHYQSALACALQVGHGQGRLRALLGLGHTMLARGEPSLAAQHFAEGLGLARQLGLRVDIAAGLEGLACLAASLDKPQRALELAGAATALRQSAEAPVSRGARHLLNPFLEPARKMLGEPAARTAFERGRALPLEAAFALGLQMEQDGSPPARLRSGPLTRRELEVASLIADGLTNRQIAERLVVSERTVAAHVEHILDRLHFRSRLQIGLWAAQRALTSPGG
jgi:predicted ATPase/DNA-binding CsgD family transcriptional regulator/transcriptional regulator with XRE-family HTH domain